MAAHPVKVKTPKPKVTGGGHGPIYGKGNKKKKKRTK